MRRTLPVPPVAATTATPGSEEGMSANMTR